MSAVAALPWAPALEPGENLLGWFRRVSTALDLGANILYRSAGMDPGTRREIIPSGLGLDLSEHQQVSLASFVRSSPERVVDATLRRFGPLLDFDALNPDDPSSVQPFAVSNPVEAIGFRACASCVREDVASVGEVVWRNLWRLQTSALCVAHSELLHGCCPGCGLLFLAGRNCPRSLRSNPSPNPEFCGSGASSRRCDFDLRLLESVPVNRDLVEAQRLINDAADSRSAMPDQERNETLKLLRYVWAVVVASGAALGISDGEVKHRNVSEVVGPANVKATRLPSIESTLAVVETVAAVLAHASATHVNAWLESAFLSVSRQRSYSGRQTLRSLDPPGQLVTAHREAFASKSNSVHRLRQLPELSAHQIPFVVPESDARRFFDFPESRTSLKSIRRAVPILLAATGAKSSFADNAEIVGMTAAESKKHAAVLTERVDNDRLMVSVERYQRHLIQTGYDRDALRRSLLPIDLVPGELWRHCCNLSNRKYADAGRQWAAYWLWQRAGLGWWHDSPHFGLELTKLRRDNYRRFRSRLSPEASDALFAWAHHV